MHHLQVQRFDSVVTIKIVTWVHLHAGSFTSRCTTSLIKILTNSFVCRERNMLEYWCQEQTNFSFSLSENAPLLVIGNTTNRFL